MLLRAILRGDLRTAFITLALSLPAIVLCLSVHEAAHGAAAYLLGDRTARNAGIRAEAVGGRFIYTARAPTEKG